MTMPSGPPIFGLDPAGSFCTHLRRLVKCIFELLLLRRCVLLVANFIEKALGKTHFEEVCTLEMEVVIMLIIPSFFFLHIVHAHQHCFSTHAYPDVCIPNMPKCGHYIL